MHALRLIDRLYRFALLCGYHVLRVIRRFTRPQIHGAYVAVWSRGRLLLIRNSYKSGCTLPAGGLKRGESHREAARRELAEEVGIEVSEDQLEFVCEVEIKNRYGSDRSHFFELQLPEDPQVVLDRREVIAWEFCPAEALSDRPLIRMVRHYLKQRAELPRPVR